VFIWKLNHSNKISYKTKTTIYLPRGWIIR
jgi:hypothetical protein